MGALYRNMEAYTHMGSCLNYGLFLGTLNIRCPSILRTQKGTLILTTMANLCKRPQIRTLILYPWGSKDSYRVPLKGSIRGPLKGSLGIRALRTHILRPLGPKTIL